MPPRVRPWIYYDATVSVCSTCYRRVDAKVLFEDERVILQKRCPKHGLERVLIADDVEYYLRSRNDYLKPSEMPRAFQTPVRYGCPYDCGLCADHEQHSCVTVIEVCDACNLTCPVCYADSGQARQEVRSLDQVVAMLDAVVTSEGEPDVVQLSGGEPTLHPEFHAILDAMRERPIRHRMVNTNGLRIAEDPSFCDRLADQGSGFEVYLQFDSLERDPLMALRGADLREVHARALANLEERGISTTLVVTLKKGLNDGECGRLIEFALSFRCVRGVTFQPIQDAGRNLDFDPDRDRLTLTEVRRNILEQTPIFSPEDIIPVPCHPDALAMAYALKLDGEVKPLTRHVPHAALVGAARNTITFEHDEGLKENLQGGMLELFSTGHSPESAASSLAQLLCCLPSAAVSPDFGYENLFRVIVMSFMDAHSLDQRSVRRSCVHIVHPEDQRIIPFDTYNLFYRGDLERDRWDPLRAAIAATV